MVFVGRTQLLSPNLPHNVITTIAPGVPGLRRYIDNDLPARFIPKSTVSAAAKLIQFKNKGLTIEDHIAWIQTMTQPNISCGLTKMSGV